MRVRCNGVDCDLCHRCGYHDRWHVCSVCFFFSSRRRHTRFDCDWSSDVCSSDLRQLESDTILGDVALALAASGLDPARLTLEVTESMLMEDVAASSERLRSLKSLGIRLAVDDFGTGYSSLAYLRGLPFDILKLDKSFVASAGRNPEAKAIVHTMIELARTLGLTTVAEGVEDTDQLRALDQEGCDLAQGYLFARPLPPREVERFFLTPLWGREDAPAG